MKQKKTEHEASSYRETQYADQNAARIEFSTDDLMARVSAIHELTNDLPADGLTVTAMFMEASIRLTSHMDEAGLTTAAFEANVDNVMAAVIKLMVTSKVLTKSDRLRVPGKKEE